MLDPTHHDRIVRILTELSTVPAARIRASDRLREDLGLDSVRRMELVSMMAEEFDLEIELEEAVAIEDVQGILRLAEARLGHA